MKRRNSRSKKPEISLLAKTIRSLKEDNDETDLMCLKSDYFPKTFNNNIKRNSSLKIFAYNQKKIFPKKDKKNSKK